VAGFQDQAATEAHLRHFFRLYRENRLHPDNYQGDNDREDSRGVEAYSRRELTGKFAKLFDQLTAT
jgi:hypothetical protein